MWPFGKTERRESTTYTDIVTRALTSYANGTGTASGLAIVETASGLWSRSWAGARVTGDQYGVCSPRVLAAIGRSLITPGESCWEIVYDGEFSLRRASTFSLEGPPDRHRYEITVAGPSESYTRHVSADGVVHVRYADHPSRAGRGAGPLLFSDLTRVMATNFEAALQEELSTPTGYTLPIPHTEGQEQLEADLQALKGGLAVVESTADAYGTGGAAPRRDYEPRRIGASPPDSLNPLRNSVNATILSACSISPAMLGMSDGTAFREAQRSFGVAVELQSTSVVQELREKLDSPNLALDFSRNRSADVVGRSRAVAALVGAGYALADAAILAGLAEQDGAA